MIIFFGIWVGLILAMLALLVQWRRRLNQHTMDPNVRAQFIRRYEKLATAIRIYPWLLLGVCLVLGIIGAILKR